MTRTEDWADYLDPSEPDPDLPLEQRLALDRVTGVLAAEPVWSPPPPGLRAAVLAAAVAPATTEPATSEPATTEHPAGERATTEPAARAPEEPPPAATPWRRSRRRSRRPWYVAAAGVAAAAALIVVLSWPRPQTTSFALTGTALAPRASAVAERHTKGAGVAISLHVTGLSPAPAGAYYAAWLRGPTGIVPVGSFHWRKGGIPIDLWSGVGGDRYPELLVTLQREGQPPSPSSQIVLSGHTGG